MAINTKTRNWLTGKTKSLGCSALICTSALHQASGSILEDWEKKKIKESEIVDAYSKTVVAEPGKAIASINL